MGTGGDLEAGCAGLRARAQELAGQGARRPGAALEPAWRQGATADGREQGAPAWRGAATGALAWTRCDGAYRPGATGRRADGAPMRLGGGGVGGDGSGEARRRRLGLGCGWRVAKIGREQERRE